VIGEESPHRSLVPFVRKIIHIDMDCFYAAIEERENPALKGKPVAVGGESRRGVLTTANYAARKFGCRSAMPVYKALELCPHLILLPVRFELYRADSARIRAIFGRFTELIEPLSLDEAYLDVSNLQTNGAAIAREIRAQIREEVGLAASAGIGPNKLVAKIASDWNKPDGQFEVLPEEVDAFVAALPVGRLWGVGKKSREQLSAQQGCPRQLWLLRLPRTLRSTLAAPPLLVKLPSLQPRCAALHTHRK
jgi:DNA polymerase-4